MVKKQMYKEILKLKNKGYSKSRIAKELKITRKTVRKYYKMCEEEYRNYRKSLIVKSKSFDRFLHDILELYKSNNNVELPMASVYDYLEEKYGMLPGTEKTLRNYIHHLEETCQLVYELPLRCFKKVPELPYGKQLQIDFGEYTTRSNLKLYIFAAVLSASRYKYIIFQDKPFTTVGLIENLLKCFDYLGGMPEELVIDQDSIMVVSENHGDIIYTKCFRYFIEEMGLRMYVCRKADPQSKGKIENVIKYIKHNFFPTRDFTDLEQANKSVRKWLSRRANGRISQATKKTPREIFEEEKETLKPVRNSIYRKDSLIGREERTVDDKALISVSGSQYSLPSKYRNKTVEIYKTSDRLYIFDLITGSEIYCHEISVIPGRKIIAREHYRQTEKKISQLKDEVVNLFDLERWRLFVDKNFKAFPRYVRDQCVLAQQYFNQKTDLVFLDGALKFCLEESKTYSMKELYDTYAYYKGLDEEDDNPPEVSAKCLGISEEKKNIHVAMRGLDVYETAISKEAI